MYLVKDQSFSVTNPLTSWRVAIQPSTLGMTTIKIMLVRVVDLVNRKLLYMFSR